MKHDLGKGIVPGEDHLVGRRFMVDRETLIFLLDRTIEYGISLYALFMFLAKGESFRSLGLYLPLAAWLLKLLLSKESRPRLSFLEIVFFLFSASLLLSALFSADPVDGLYEFQRGPLKTAILFSVIGYNFSTWQSLRRLSLTFALLGCLVAAIGLYNYAYVTSVGSGGGITIFGSAHKNHFAMVLGHLIPFLMASALTAYTLPGRLLFRTFFLVSIMAMVLSLSRGGWGSLLVTLLIWGAFLLQSRSRLVLKGVMVLLVLGMVVAWGYSGAIAERLESLKTDLFTLNLRAPLIWKPYWEAVKERPLLGWGPRDYRTLQSEMYPAYYTQIYGEGPKANMGTHSFYLSILIYGGFIGLLAYLSLASILVGTLYKRISETSLWPRKAILIAVFSAFIAVYLVHGTIEHLMWRPLGVFLGFGAACARRGTKDAEAT